MKLNKVKLGKILADLNNARKILSTMSNEERDFIQLFHNEGTTLQHCLRWGIQAVEELLDVNQDDQCEA